MKITDPISNMENDFFQLLGSLAQPELNYPVMCNIIIEHTKLHTKSQNGYIGLIQNSTDTLEVHYRLSPSDPEYSEEHPYKIYSIHRLPDHTFPGLRGHAINTGKSFYTNNPSEHPATTGFPQEHIPIKNYISTPVYIGTEIVGVISLANADHDYDDTDLTIIEKIGSFFAVLISRFRQETQIRNQRQYLQSLIDNFEDQIWSVDLNYRLLAINKNAKDEFERLDGCATDIGDETLTKVSEELATYWKNIYQRCFEGDQYSFVECSEFTRNRYKEIFISPLKVDDCIVGATILARDITKYVQAEKNAISLFEEINYSHNILQSVMNNINSIILVIDIQTYRILFMNSYAISIYGDITGEICWQKCHEGRTSRCDGCPLETLLSDDPDKPSVHQIEFLIYDKWFLTTSTIIDWIDKRKVQLQIATDITDRIEAEKQLQQTAETLSELNATKDKFFSIIAHDLKNPFYSLLGFADLIRNHYKELSFTDLQEYGNLIYNSAHSAHQLLQNLLIWAQSQSGKIQFEPIPSDIIQIVQNCVELIEPAAFQKSITVERYYQPVQQLLLDRNMITTIIRNLLSNAVKFTNRHGTIKVYVIKSSAWLQIVIEDNGVGISAEDIEKLFRIDVDNRKIGKNLGDLKGTGLGLIISKEFITHHGGYISVRSEPSVSTAFTVNIPIPAT